jgi:phosphopantetheinyl transferase
MRKFEFQSYAFHKNRISIGIAPLKNDSESLLAQLENKDLYLPFIERMPENRKREWLSVRILLKEMSGEEKQILYSESGKPYLVDRSFYISISHTKGYATIILDREKPTAIDIEQISPRIEKVENRFINEIEEKNLSSQNRIIHLLLHWSAKESMFKILDTTNIQFKTQLHIHPFEPVINEWSEFTALKTGTQSNRSFHVGYFVHNDYVLTYLV